MRADTQTRATLFPAGEAALTVAFLWAMLTSAGTDINAWLTDLLIFFSTVLFNSLTIVAPREDKGDREGIPIHTLFHR